MRVLLKAGDLVEEALNGADAFRQVQAFRPGLVLLEAVAICAKRNTEIAAIMPEMDGPTTIQIVHIMSPRLPIIAVSGIPAAKHAAGAAIQGVKLFLPKPYTAEVLLNALNQALSVQSADLTVREAKKARFRISEDQFSDKVAAWI